MQYELPVVDEFVEYYLFNEKGVINSTSGGIKIAFETQLVLSSGLVDQTKKYGSILYTQGN